MHRAAKFIADHAACPLAALLLLSAPPGAEAAAVQSPYVVTVPQSDPTQAVQDAMRVELVRLTGTREAVTDPALAPIVDGGRQYVQIERGTTSGQTQVLFDATALRAAIEAAGRSVWDLNRPLLWISLPFEDATTDQLLRNRLATAAEERGLPIVIAPTSPGAAVDPADTPGHHHPERPAGAVRTAAPGHDRAAAGCGSPGRRQRCTGRTDDAGIAGDAAVDSGRAHDRRAVDRWPGACGRECD